MIVERRCLLCRKRISQTTDQNILPLEIPENRGAFEFSTILDHNIGFWKVIKDFEWRCNDDKSCGGEKQEKITIITNNSAIIVQLGVFTRHNDGTYEKRENVKIKNLPNAKIKIGNNLFTLNNSIHHHGNSPHAGHYTNMIRHEKSNWFYVSDLQVKSERWPKCAKNAYILFLEKIDT